MWDYYYTDIMIFLKCPGNYRRPIKFGMWIMIVINDYDNSVTIYATITIAIYATISVTGSVTAER